VDTAHEKFNDNFATYSSVLLLMLKIKILFLQLGEEKFMLAVKGTYQNGQLFLKEQLPFTQPVTVIVTFLDDFEQKILSNPVNQESILSITDNKLLGLFAHQAELIDEITESAMQAREKEPLRCSERKVQNQQIIIDLPDV
jgi:hypothetical protein